MSRMKDPRRCGRKISVRTMLLGLDSAGNEVWEWGLEPCALTWGHYDTCKDQAQVDKNNTERKNRVDNRPNSKRPKSSDAK